MRTLKVFGWVSEVGNVIELNPGRKRPGIVIMAGDGSKFPIQLKSQEEAKLWGEYLFRKVIVTVDTEVEDGP
jgi:hypothetical protein